MAKISGSTTQSTTQAFLPGLSGAETPSNPRVEDIGSSIEQLNVPSASTVGESANLSSTDFESDLSRIIESRNRYLDRDFTPMFLACLKEEDAEFGFYSETEQLLRRQLEIESTTTLHWLSRLYQRYFSNKQILTGLLRLLERFDEEDL